jgi:uncharacterized protein (DUF983 family)
MCSVHDRDSLSAKQAADEKTVDAALNGRPMQPGGGPGTLRRWWGTVWAIVRQRCPRCREGRMFRGSLAMNDPCPVCGLIFQREEGYFLGAMYVSYLLASALLVPLYFAATVLFPGWDSMVVALVVMVPYLLFVPAVFRYSRAVWIYFDRAADPSAICAGPYEKVRLSQVEAKRVART